MAITFSYKFKSVSVEYQPNDTSVAITGYLADSAGTPFVDPNTGAVDSFVTSFLRSRLPASGYESFLSIAIGKTIRDKYTKVKGVVLLSGSQNVSGIEDTSDLVPGLLASGAGVPTDTTLEAIKGPNEVKLSANSTVSGEATVTFSSAGWTIDFSELERLTEVVDLSEL